eukprot:GAHX01000132.1.p1 GENE.GAHX01000132.1~~GAHX01000132.1.p1  ORF type:complete len:350 (+),score=52.21 GAHX01000132.1:65-1114(+)
MIEKIDKLIQRLTKTKTFKMTNEEILYTINLSKEMFAPMPNIIDITSPLTICGDIHGQYEDLLTLFRVCGYPPYTKFLFLGDYVDRGYASLETILLLLLLKLKYPTKVNLIRGNHESRLITPIYGFYDECLKKTSSVLIWKNFMELFDLFPLCANIDGKILTMHGGLGPNVQKLEDISTLDRKQEVPHEGAMCDLLWSDPYISNLDGKEIDLNNIQDDETNEVLDGDDSNVKISLQVESDNKASGYMVSTRGAGVLFGPDITDQFLRNNDLEMIARAHQIVPDGFLLSHDNQLITLFSAPNYCYRCGNKAGVMELSSDSTRTLKNFGETDRLEGEERNMDQYQKPDYFL